MLDLVRRDGTHRRHPGLPPSAPLPPLEQVWRYASDQANFFAELAAASDGAFTIDLPPPYGPLVGFTDPDAIHRIVTGTSEEFGNANAIVSLFVGPSSMLLLDGDPHAKARGRTLAAFAGDRMRGYGPTILATADRALARLWPGQVFSAKELGRDFALEVILRALFGVTNEAEFAPLFDSVLRFMSGAHNPVGTMVSMFVPAALSRRFISGARDPWTMRAVPTQGWDRLGGSLPGVRDGRAMIDGLVGLIEARQADLDVDRGDALGTILRRARDSGQPYSMEQALDETLTLLLAGHDTTAITLAWFLYRIASAPRVLARMRAEFDEAFGDGPIDVRRIERLPYLGAVIDEGLRLDGIGRGVGRRTVTPMRLGGWDLPAGTFVLAYTHARNESADHWEDPRTFVPERMLDRRLRPHEFAPFGAGYRRCIGAGFAEYEMKILLASIVRTLDVSYVGPTPLPVGMMGPITAPTGPVPIRVDRVRARAATPAIAAE